MSEAESRYKPKPEKKVGDHFFAELSPEEAKMLGKQNEKMYNVGMYSGTIVDINLEKGYYIVQPNGAPKTELPFYIVDRRKEASKKSK